MKAIKIHTFGNRKLPVMMLVHGLLCPWQIWEEHISHFQDRYHVLAVALSAHTEEESSEFISLEHEVWAIEQYCMRNAIDTIDVLCGLSLGGIIIYEIWKNGKVPINNLILDGVPLIPCPQFAVKTLMKSYLKIMHQSKARNERVLAFFKKRFAPEKYDAYLGSYLAISDFMTDQSMENMVRAAFKGSMGKDVINRSRILCLHGSKRNEMISRISALRMKKCYPETRVICFKGDAHCHKAIYEPRAWIAVVEGFILQAKEASPRQT